MNRLFLSRLIGSLAIALAVVTSAAPARAGSAGLGPAAATTHWVDSWSTPLHSSAASKPVPALADQTVRNLSLIHI